MQEPFSSSALSSLGRALDLSLFAGAAVEVAPLLLGKILLRSWKGGYLGGLICETEAYAADDPASHSFKGMSPRNRSMFSQAGTLYVYRSYGIHYCLNVSTGPEGVGEAVLIRALQPLYGLRVMRELRKLPEVRPDHELSNGPGKLAQALAIDMSFDGQILNQGLLRLLEPAATAQPLVDSAIRGPRIGISRGLDRLWRFGLKEHPSLSRPFPPTLTSAP